MKQKIMKTPFAINPKIKAPIVYTFASDQIGDKIYKRNDNGLTVDMHKYFNIILTFQSNVKPTTFRLFVHITYLCSDNSNVITISPKTTMNEMNICLSAFRNSVDELVTITVFGGINGAICS